MNEHWKIIPGLDECYSVSTLGRVKNNNNQRIMSLTDNWQGYKVIRLQRKHFRVHRLVAYAFLSNEQGLPEINHKNCDKKDNIVSNLEWCTPSYNRWHAVENNKISTKRVIDQNGTIYRSVRDASRKTGVDSSSISKVCKGKYRHAGGYNFAYYPAMEAWRRLV